MVKPVYNLMGVTDLRQFLQGIDQWVQRRVVIRTMEKSCGVMVEQARRNIEANESVDTGALKKSIGVVVREYPKSRHITAVIGPRVMSFVKSLSGKARAAKSKDKSAGMIKPFKYAHLVEFGHVQTRGEASPAFTKGVGNKEKNKTRRNGQAVSVSFVPAKPFLRPAYESSRVFVEARILESFKEAIAREAVRMTKKLQKLVKLAA